MNINIGNIQGRLTPVAKEPSPNSGRQETGGLSKAPESADSVNLTDAAHRLRQADQSSPSEQASGNERLAQIARAVERGEYSIDPERLADKFLRLEREIAK